MKGQATNTRSERKKNGVRETGVGGRERGRETE